MIYLLYTDRALEEMVLFVCHSSLLSRSIPTVLEINYDNFPHDMTY
jgi:hypothetical protein